MDYKKRLCETLNLPVTATDDDIAARCVALLGAILSAAAGVKAFSALRAPASWADAEVARQMGNRPEALAIYGSSTRA